MNSVATFSIDGHIDSIEMLNNEATDADGWEQMVDKPNVACFLKKTEG